MFALRTLVAGILLCNLMACRTTSDEGTSTKDVAVNGNYKSPQLISYETFLYGAFEARIKAGKGSGVITPFFLYKMGGERPGAEWEELDFEIFGKDGRFQTQVMTPGNPRTEHQTFHALPGDALAYDDYHVYRLEWTPTAIRFYLDGALIRTETDPVEFAKFFDKNRVEPMSLWISCWAMNNDWAGMFDRSAVPTYALVNYIQAESYTPAKGANGGDFTVKWRDNFDRLDYHRWSLSSGHLQDAVNAWSPGQASVKNNNLILYFSN